MYKRFPISRLTRSSLCVNVFQNQHFQQLYNSGYYILRSSHCRNNNVTVGGRSERNVILANFNGKITVYTGFYQFVGFVAKTPTRALHSAHKSTKNLTIVTKHLLFSNFTHSTFGRTFAFSPTLPTRPVGFVARSKEPACVRARTNITLQSIDSSFVRGNAVYTVRTSMCIHIRNKSLIDLTSSRVGGAGRRIDRCLIFPLCPVLSCRQSSNIYRPYD